MARRYCRRRLQLHLVEVPFVNSLRKHLLHQFAPHRGGRHEFARRPPLVPLPPPPGLIVIAENWLIFRLLPSKILMVTQRPHTASAVGMGNCQKASSGWRRNSPKKPENLVC